jgi:hypothetical protein
MKAEVKIPKGWRRVPRGKSKDGDRYLSMAFLSSNMRWLLSDVGNIILIHDLYIRKVKKGKK